MKDFSYKTKKIVKWPEKAMNMKDFSYKTKKIVKWLGGKGDVMTLHHI